MIMLGRLGHRLGQFVMNIIAGLHHALFVGFQNANLRGIHGDVEWNSSGVLLHGDYASNRSQEVTLLFC